MITQRSTNLEVVYTFFSILQFVPSRHAAADRFNFLVCLCYEVEQFNVITRFRFSCLSRDLPRAKCRLNHSQKRAINAVTSSRLALDRASGNLKATSSIVFQIKKILEMNRFTNVSSA